MPEEKKQIVVDQATLEGVLKKLQDTEDKVKMLESIADKGELAKFYDKTADRTKRTYKLRVLRGDSGEKLVVTGWGPMITNEVFQNAQGISVAKQVVKVQLEDGKEVVGELLDIGRRYEFIQAEKVEVVKSYKDDKDAEWEVLKLKVENGKIYEIDSHFVN